jgi:hypothetical protein
MNKHARSMDGSPIFHEPPEDGNDFFDNKIITRQYERSRPKRVVVSKGIYI